MYTNQTGTEVSLSVVQPIFLLESSPRRVVSPAYLNLAA